MPLWLFVALVATQAASAPPSQTIEIDRTLQHVYLTPIMASDVRQAKLLRLVPDADGTDDRVLTALENRLLMLREAGRQAGPQPAPPAIAARRKVWAESWPPGTDLAALMAKAGMNDQAIDGWFRDDLRINAYLDVRFGLQPDDGRAKRVADWLAELRRRANLSDRRP